MHKLLCLARRGASRWPRRRARRRTFTVALRPLADEKAVFATVESRNVVPARARIGGTVARAVGARRR